MTNETAAKNLGNRFVKDSLLDKAITVYELARKKSDNPYLFAEELAAIYDKQGNFEKAIAIYPKFLNAAFDRARLLDAMQRYDEALAAYRLTTTIDTVFTAPYFSMGIIYDYKKNPEEAIVCYEKFLSNHPQQMETYANLSFDYFKLKQFDKSIAVNHRALAANPGAFDPVLNIAKTYRQIDATDSALVYFERAKAIRPDYPELDVAIAGLKNKPK